MKKAKIMTIAITILIAIGGLMAFTVYKKNGATFLCQNSEGSCVYTAKYKIAVPPWTGQLMYCNDGYHSTMCNNQVWVVAESE